MNQEEALRAALASPLERTDLPGLGEKYEGKVRDCYSRPDGRRFLVATDRISAFDRVLGTLPLKGQVLTWVSAFWFEHTKDVAPSHFIGVPHPNVMECIECTPLPVELVVRAYLTGVTSTSIWTHYARGERTFCGHRLPDGLVKHGRLPEPILTPSTKAAKGGHDVSVSREQILAMGGLTATQFDRAAEMAMALFAAGQAHCAERGLILVDTKYEMGKGPDGRILVMDEIHTPDSSRFWMAETYESRMSQGLDPDSFDKEYVRRWLAARGFTGDGPIPPIPDDIRLEASRRYISACERIVGRTFVGVPDAPLPTTL